MFYNTLIVTFCILSIYQCGAMSDDPRKIIIDTDAGGDDAVAIFLALAAKEVQVIAITCVYGNTDEVNVETNVLKILTVANRTDIPVYGGAKKPLIQNYTAGDFFGKDGFGDFEFNRKILGHIDRSKHASIAMIDIVKQHPGDISIITLGPLTNVALAASLDPNFTQNVKKFYVMGSTIHRPKANAEIEFNFSLDPESNDIFLSSPTKLKSLIAPWNVVVKSNISKEWRTEVLGKLNSDVMNILNKVESIVLEKVVGWLPADSIAVATMIWEDLVTKSLEAKMTSVTHGPSKGSVIVETDSKTKNVEIVTEIDVTSYKNKLLTHLA